MRLNMEVASVYRVILYTDRWGDKGLARMFTYVLHDGRRMVRPTSVQTSYSAPRK
jgi:hypothetical protein